MNVAINQLAIAAKLPVGASLLAKAVGQLASILNVLASSRQARSHKSPVANPLPPTLPPVRRHHERSAETS